MQTRVSHWNDLLSTLTSVSAKPLKVCWYSSSGTQGSPMPPLSQPSAERPSKAANGKRNWREGRIIVLSTVVDGQRRDGSATFRACGTLVEPPKLRQREMAVRAWRCSAAH